MSRRSVLLAFLAGLLAAAPASLRQAHASGADALLQSVAPAPKAQAPRATEATAPSAAPASAPQVGNFQLDDPMLAHLFAAWQGERQLPYEAHAWIQSVLRKQWAPAAHLWSAVEPKFPSSLRQTTRATWVYLLYRLGLAQSVVDQWLEYQADEAFVQSTASSALDQVIGASFDQFLREHEIQLSPEQETRAQALDARRGMHVLSLQGYAALRRPEAALAIVPRLPLDHPYKVPLAQTAAIGFARKGDLASAGKILKEQLEPAIEARRDPLLLAGHYLQVARLLYQAGALDGAETYYSKVPNSVPEYLKAREELAWVLLRKGDTVQLRGQLKTLGSGVFDQPFAPELYLVKAISDLKLCYYDAVEQDFAKFTQLNGQWARKIDQALKATERPAPETLDSFSRMARSALAKREAEAVRLAQLAQESITAILPAVGPQAHWSRLKDQGERNVDAAKKRLSAEYSRQWNNYRQVLAEAIRKMQFVKVELMSQLAELARPEDLPKVAAEGADTIESSSAAALRSEKPLSELVAKEGDMAFRFDGVIWTDEMFRLKSTAANRCLSLQRKGAL